MLDESGVPEAPWTAEDQVFPTVVGHYASAAVTDLVCATDDDLHSPDAVGDAEIFLLLVYIIVRYPVSSSTSSWVTAALPFLSHCSRAVDNRHPAYPHFVPSVLFEKAAQPSADDALLPVFPDPPDATELPEEPMEEVEPDEHAASKSVTEKRETYASFFIKIQLPRRS